MAEYKEKDDECTLDLSLKADSVEEMRTILFTIAENLEEIEKNASSGEPSLGLKMRGKARYH